MKRDDDVTDDRINVVCEPLAVVAQGHILCAVDRQQTRAVDVLVRDEERTAAVPEVSTQPLIVIGQVGVRTVLEDVRARSVFRQQLILFGNIGGGLIVVRASPERAHRKNRRNRRKVLPRVDIGEPSVNLLDLDSIDSRRDRGPVRLGRRRIDRRRTPRKEENQEENSAEVGNHGNPGLGTLEESCEARLYRTCAPTAEADKIRRFLPADFPQSPLTLRDWGVRDE